MLSKLYPFIYVLLVFGCAGYLLLHAGFPLLALGTLCGVCRFLAGVAGRQGAQGLGPGLGSVALAVSLHYVGSSQTRVQNRVSHIAEGILLLDRPPL